MRVIQCTSFFRLW